MTYDIRNPGPGLGQSQKCGRAKLLIGCQPVFKILLNKNLECSLYKGLLYFTLCCNKKKWKTCNSQIFLLFLFLLYHSSILNKY